jgi:5-dehydro-4-deoxyglucarate dehydratase
LKLISAFEITKSMQPNQLRERLQGVVAFPITPFKADLSLDLEGLRRNLRELLKHPVCAVVAPGGTGELYSLSPAEHLAVVTAAAAEIAGRTVLIAGAGFNPPIAADLARRAAAAGAHGILAFPPYYPNPDDEGLLAYYQGIAEATELGMLIYARDWFNPSPALAARLATIPSLVAWKDGQGDLRRLQLIRQRVGARLHWIGGAGDDLVPGYYALGLRTYTSSIANVAPRLSLRLHELASAGASTELNHLLADLVVPLYELRARRRGYEVSVMKAMMDMVGLAGGPVRPPIIAARPDELETLRGMVERWKQWM